MVELGAGTGKVTSERVARVLRVVAVEPVARMAAELSARLPAVQVLVATAESNGLPGGQAEAVLAAQSLHRFAARDAVQEMRRLPRPRGWLVLLWNLPEPSHPVGQAMAELIEPLRADAPTDEGDRWCSALDLGSEFGTVIHCRFGHTVTASREGLDDRVPSIRCVACQREEVRRRIQAELDCVWSRQAPGPGGDRLPYQTDMCLARAGA